jgi:predicted porin
MLKKVLCGAIVAAGAMSAGVALAQSNVTIYGIIDTGVVYTTNANANGNSIFKMSALSGELPSRIGFKGVEDLGDGLAAIFVLENGFSPDSGTIGQGGRLFGRQSYVGLKSNAWGQIMLGRQVNMTFLAPAKSDVIGPNVFSVGSLDGYWPNARSDNAIGYIGTFNQFTVGATYSLGRDTATAGGPAATNCGGEVAGNAKACRQITALLAYDNQAYGVSTSYDIMYGNTGAAGGLSSSDNTDQRVTLSGYVMLGSTRIGGGVLDRKTRAAANVNTDSDLWFLGAAYPITPALTLDGQIAKLNFKGSDNDSTMTIARLTYNLSKRTAVYSSIGYMKNSGTAALALDAGGTIGVGKNQAGMMLGLKHIF